MGRSKFSNRETVFLPTSRSKGWMDGGWNPMDVGCVSMCVCAVPAADAATFLLVIRSSAGRDWPAAKAGLW